MSAVRGSLLVVIVLSLSACLGCSKSKPATLIEDYDPVKMEQAIADARASFDTFLARFKNPLPGDKAFNVKVKIQDANGIEHFWVGDLKLDAEPYSGKIGNEPGVVKNVRLGQNYNFSRADISDWMYLANGKLEGNYTLKVELESMPAEQSAAIKKKFGW